MDIIEDITLFVHRPGVEAPVEIRIGGGATADDLLARTEVSALVIGIGAGAEGVQVFVEEDVTPLARHLPLSHGGARHGSRLHLSRCHEVEVEVHFVDRTAHHRFPPGTRLRRVKDWATQHFGLVGNDAIEHVLKVQGTSEMPSPGWSLSTLVHGHHCKVSFDLVPAKRVEG